MEEFIVCAVLVSKEEELLVGDGEGFDGVLRLGDHTLQEDLVVQQVDELITGVPKHLDVLEGVVLVLGYWQAMCKWFKDFVRMEEISSSTDNRFRA